MGIGGLAYAEQRYDTEVVWSPQEGPQTELMACDLPEIFFGGARGGGKTDGVLGKYAVKAARYGRAFNALFLRLELPMLDDAIERSKEIYSKIGAHYFKQAKTWMFPGGGRLRFRPMETIEDAAKYQGQNVTDACVEEAGLYKSMAPIDRLQGVLRSAHGTPTQLILTGNPGGPLQSALKERYIDPAPMGRKVLKRVLPNGNVHRYCFIPSRVSDNALLLANDPEYINRLYLVGSPQLVAAWLDGDWTAIEGAYFSEFGARHILEPFEIPSHWMRFMSFDWGSYRPFCALWFAVSDGTVGNIPRGAIVVYREYYGAKSANVGLKLHADVVAENILRHECAGEPIAYRKCDPACFKCDGGPSIAEVMRLKGVVFSPADNSRLAGWQQVRARLVGEDAPMLYMFSTCVNLIRTLPLLQHDSVNGEDLDSDGEDHCADTLRYGLMSRPWLRLASKPERPRDNNQIYGDEIMDVTRVRHERR